MQAAAQSHRQHFTRGLSQQHLAWQEEYNAPLFPGKGCSNTAPNSDFLWLTTAPRLSPPPNPSASVHCQNIYYFSLNAARSYLLQYCISHHFCYHDYFILLVEIQILHFMDNISQFQVISILLHWHLLKISMQLGRRLYFYKTLPRKLPQIYYSFFPHKSWIIFFF